MTEDKIILMPVVKKPQKGMHWDFATIEGVMRHRLTSFRNPDSDKVAHCIQYGRPICVGAASAKVRGYLNARIVKEVLTGQIVRGINENGVTRDQLQDQAFSAQCAYTWAREEGHVIYPAGAYCGDSIKSMTKRGICLEKQWWTSTSPALSWNDPYPSPMQEVVDEAAKHVLDGYAAIDSLEDLLICLETRGVALGAINICSNYTECQMILEDGVYVLDGNLPEYNGEEVGSHALCWIGFDDIKRRLYFEHTWPGWSRFGSVSYDYWVAAQGDFWAPLDEHETAIGNCLYQKITFDVTPPEARSIVTLVIDGVTRTETLPASISIQRGHPILVMTSAPGYKTLIQTITVDENVSSIMLTLEAEVQLPPPVVDNPFVRAVINFLKWIAEKMIFWRKK